MSQFFINLDDKENSERFSPSKFFAFTDNYDPLTSYFANNIRKLAQSGYMRVEGDEGRPDNTSYKIYGDVQYWWILLLYNGKLEFDTFMNGEVVKFPSVDDVEDMFFSLKSFENAQQAANL